MPGPNVFVAVGAEGRRTISEDHGATWNDTDRVWGQYRDIVAAEGRLVAVGRDEGVGMISISEDGEHWVDATPPGEDLEWLAHAAGQFVTLGAQGGCWTSDDGAGWTSCDLQMSGSWNLVGVDDRFWALGPEGVFTSTDGEHWSTSEFPLPAQLVGAFGGFVMANDGTRGFAPDLETGFETVQLGAGGLRGLAAGTVRREVGL